MIDSGKEPGRIDLGVITEDSQLGNVDRVMAEVHRRRAGNLGNARLGVFAILVEHSRPLVAAAAILLTISMGSLALTSERGPVVPPEVTLAEWARSNHVPTNAELLIAFEGYGR